MTGRTLSHYQILEMLGERKMDPSLKPRSPGGAEIATENARSLPLSGYPPAAVGRILCKSSLLGGHDPVCSWRAPKWGGRGAVGHSLGRTRSPRPGTQQQYRLGQHGQCRSREPCGGHGFRECRQMTFRSPNRARSCHAGSDARHRPAVRTDRLGCKPRGGRRKRTTAL